MTMSNLKSGEGGKIPVNPRGARVIYADFFARCEKSARCEKVVRKVKSVVVAFQFLFEIG